MGSFAHHRADSALQGGRAIATAVLNHHPKPARRANAANRWGDDDEDEPFLDCRKFCEQGGLNRGRGFLGITSARLERIEHDEHSSGIGRICARCAGKSDNIDGVSDAGNFERQFYNPPVDGIGSFKRRCRGQLSDRDQIAAVELRNEADGRLAEFISAKSDDDRVDDENNNRHPHKLGNKPAIARR